MTENSNNGYIKKGAVYGGLIVFIPALLFYIWTMQLKTQAKTDETQDTNIKDLNIKLETNLRGIQNQLSNVSESLGKIKGKLNIRE